MYGTATQSPYLTGNFGTMTNRFGLNVVSQNYRQGFDVPSAVLDIKGKGKFKETDFDAAFAQIASSLDTTPARVEDTTSAAVDPVEELEKDLSQAKLDDVPVVNQEDAIRHVEFKECVVFAVLTVCSP
jgi:hypothetical protein